MRKRERDDDERRELEKLNKRLDKVERKVGYLATQLKVMRREV